MILFREKRLNLRAGFCAMTGWLCSCPRSREGRRPKSRGGWRRVERSMRGERWRPVAVWRQTQRHPEAAARKETQNTHISSFLFLKTTTTTQANSVCFDYLFCHLQLNLILLSGLLSVLFIYQTNIGDAFIELAKNNYKNNLFQSQQYLRMFLVLE